MPCTFLDTLHSGIALVPCISALSERYYRLHFIDLNEGWQLPYRLSEETFGLSLTTYSPLNRLQSLIAKLVTI